MRGIHAGAMVLAGSLVAALGGGISGPAQELPKGVTPEMIQEGKQIFAGPGLCSVCHGEDGHGGPIGPDLSDDEWLHGDGSYEFIVQQIMKGVPEPIHAAATMPPRGGSQITDDQVRAVAAYVWSLRLAG